MGEIKERTGSEAEEVLEVVYTKDEGGYFNFLLHRLQDAHNKRSQSYPEFNDMTYQEYWRTNARAANSYIRPRTSKGDTRVVTGTTEEKENTILASVLKQNFQPSVLAFDKDNMLMVETGMVLGDMIKKSREVERPTYDESRIGVYKEFFDQGTVFIEEKYLELRIPQKKLMKVDWSLMGSIKDIKWDTTWKTEKMCMSSVITGLNVYLGSMRELYMENQPYIFTREITPRRLAEALYGRWERWKNVGHKTKSILDTSDLSAAYNNFNLEDEGNSVVGQDDLIEIIRYQDKWNNEFMIVMNGVMMLPVRFPLSALMGRAEYTIAKGDAFPISRNFAYSKSIPAKTKVEQQVFDELLRLLVLKTQQSFQPPMANNTGRLFSKDVFFPGKMTENIDPNKLKPLVDARGVSPSEINGLAFLKQIIDGKSVNPIMEGQASAGEQTAREIVELKQQSVQKLGLPILGVINLEKKMAELRLINLLQNWTSPIDRRPDMAKKKLVDIFRTISVDTDLEDGSKGQRITEMMGGELPVSEQVMAEEELLTRKLGKKTRKIYMNPAQITSVLHSFFIRATPQPQDASELRKALFNESLQFAAQIFGIESLNMEYIKQRWATLNDEDPDKMFLQQPSQAASLQAGQGEGQASNLSQQLTKAQRPQRTQPSINTLVNG